MRKTYVVSGSLLTATHLTTQNRRQTVQFIHQHQVLERPWLKKERISFLKRHGRRELWLLIIITQVSYLVQVTSDRKQEQQHVQCKAHVAFSKKGLARYSGNREERNPSLHYVAIEI